jgi:uncharacterized protein
VTVPELGPALDEHGYAVVRGWLDPARCGDLAGWYADDHRFRSTIVMARHGYGRGEYRYFRYPLPPLVTELRGALYAALAPTANAWSERLGARERFPGALPELLDRCHAAGQERPTPLLLRYGAGDYNALHQDTYGEIAFPLQGTVLLSERGDFTGGEFVLVEGKPRRQSVAHVVPLERGDLVVFPNKLRPNDRGGRSTFRHGVAELRSGNRLTLGLILHDAQ